jgi:hypothetical protein
VATVAEVVVDPGFEVAQFRCRNCGTTSTGRVWVSGARVQAVMTLDREPWLRHAEAMARLREEEEVRTAILCARCPSCGQRDVDGERLLRARGATSGARRRKTWMIPLVIACLGLAAALFVGVVPMGIEAKEVRGNIAVIVAFTGIAAVAVFATLRYGRPDRIRPLREMEFLPMPHSHVMPAERRAYIAGHCDHDSSNVV